MAVELLAELIGTPLVDALRRRWPDLVRKAEAALDWLREVSGPPRGLELRSTDGSTYTGIVIFERSRPVMMLAVCHPPGPAIGRVPVFTPPPRERAPYLHGFDPDSPVWDRDGDPFGR